MEENRIIKMVDELLKYLYDKEISEDVIIYTSDKSYYIDDNKNIIIEDNKIDDYFDIYDENLKINISMDSILGEYISCEVEDSEKICEDIEEILSKYNLFYSLGSSWYMVLHKNN